MATELSRGQRKSIALGCAVESCQEDCVAKLDGQALCLDHFFAECYASLDGFERYRKKPGAVREINRVQLRAFLEECSGQALNVSLCCQKMNNLQRARLLDVLLWAGELSEFASASRDAVAQASVGVRAGQTPVSKGAGAEN